jgi:hypothetical protein
MKRSTSEQFKDFIGTSGNNELLSMTGCDSGHS